MLLNHISCLLPVTLFVSAGKRGALRASDHDANWSDDSWAVYQLGPNNPKKLKKSKSKDESLQRSVVFPFILIIVQYLPHPFTDIEVILLSVKVD